MKVTTAMRQWCKRLAWPARCTWFKRRENALDVSVRGFSPGHRPTYVMAGNMEAAGLIKFEARPTEVGQPGVEWVAVLTDRGNEIAQS